MSRVRVKICGLTAPDAVDAAVQAGADALGFVFAESPRRVTTRHAVALTDDLPAFVSPVAVFRVPSESTLTEVWIATRFSYIQMDAACKACAWNGQEGSPPVLPRYIRVFRLGPLTPREVVEQSAAHDTLLVEGARSGAGETIDWPSAASLARQRRIILAGGLTPDNVAEAIRTVRPYGVDVSSGVESSPGLKDPIKIRDFIQAVRAVERDS